MAMSPWFMPLLRDEWSLVQAKFPVLLTSMLVFLLLSHKLPKTLNVESMEMEQKQNSNLTELELNRNGNRTQNSSRNGNRTSMETETEHKQKLDANRT